MSARIFRCWQPWTQRRLDWITEKIDAPLEMIPPGMLTPDVTRIIFGGPHFRRLLRLRDYLARRMARARDFR